MALQKLLDDSLEFLAFGCCVCWVCSRTSHKVFSNHASWDSNEIFWEVLPFSAFVFGSLVLLLIMGAAASSWDVSVALVLLLPIVCSAFVMRRCPLLLQWLLCGGLFLQILHHGLEHSQTHSQKQLLTSVECRAPNGTKSNLRMMGGLNKNLEEDTSRLADRTIAAYQADEIATLQSTVDIQTKRIQTLTAEKDKQASYEEKDLSMLESTVDIQRRHIDALNKEISMLKSEKDLLSKTVGTLTDRNQFLEHSRIVR